MAIHVVQGERELVSDCRSPGAFRTARHSADGGRCGPHPRELPGRCRWPAERVGARADLGVEATVQVKPSYGLADEEIARMLGGFSSRRGHAGPRLREAQVEADRMLLATQAALAADGDLLSGRSGGIDALLPACNGGPAIKPKPSPGGRGPGQGDRGLCRCPHEPRHPGGPDRAAPGHLVNPD
jgi:molecular chaperone HscA